VLATARKTVGAVFGRVLLLPLGRVFFLASDGALHTELAGRLQERNRPVQWMKPSYLTTMLSPDRLADMDRAAAEPAMRNTDFHPVLYFVHVRHWLSQFPSVPRGLLALIAMGMVVYVWRIGRVPRAVLASGVAASAFEVVLLLAVQVACGSLYQQMGVVVVVFMAGLALGGWYGREALWLAPNRSVGWVVVMLGLYAMALPSVLKWAAHGAPRGLGALGPMAVVLILTLLLAMLAGVIFPLSGRAMSSGATAAASRLYTADFVGAWFGAVLAGAVLVPKLGVAGMCRAVAVFVLGCGLAVLAGKQPRS